jgi:hypothetical protein
VTCQRSGSGKREGVCRVQADARVGSGKIIIEQGGQWGQGTAGSLLG